MIVAKRNDCFSCGAPVHNYHKELEELKNELHKNIGLAFDGTLYCKKQVPTKMLLDLFAEKHKKWRKS